MPATPKANAGLADTILVLGAELGMLGIATLIAASSEDAGKVILVFVVGILILFMFRHTVLTGAIPKLFNTQTIAK